MDHSFELGNVFNDGKVAVAYCGSHKTLAFGMPLLATVFGGGAGGAAGGSQLALLTAPLLVCHPIKLLLGGLVAPRFKAYTEEYPAYASMDTWQRQRREIHSQQVGGSCYSERPWAIIQKGLAAAQERP